MSWIRASGSYLCIAGVSALLAAGCREPGESPRSQQTGSEQALLCRGPQPGAASLRLLTRTQFNNTLLDLLGDDSAPANAFPAEHRVENFENNAETHRANPLLIEEYWAAAREVSTRAVENNLDSIAPCSVVDTGSCADAFILGFGKRAFRRPVLPAEREVFRQLFDKAEATMGYSAGIGLVLEALLQSPQFLYRVEAARAPTEETGAVALGGYEVASRLSYFLWNSMPDEQLFAAAESQQLASAEEIEMQARRMLESPKARVMVKDFYRQWLNLDRFDGLARDTADLQLDARGLMEGWRQSLLSFVDFVYWGGSGSMQELFSSDLIFVDQDLAQLYGVVAPAEDHLVGVPQTGMRAGLLTQPALMAMLSHADQSSPIQRGVFIRAQLLCDPPQPPPPTVDNNPPDPDPTLTTRERFAVHTESPVCASCHQLIDPLGFGLENYDQFGRYRSEENLLPIDTSGAVVASPDPAIDGPFSTPLELAQRLASSETVRDCLATHWYRFAMGRVEQQADTCSLDQAKSHFKASNGDLKELLVALTLTDAFRYRPAISEAL